MTSGALTGLRHKPWDALDAARQTRGGSDPRRHPLTHDERARGGVQAYGLLLMERPTLAWWVLNTHIRKQARAARDEALKQIIKDVDND